MYFGVSVKIVWQFVPSGETKGNVWTWYIDMGAVSSAIVNGTCIIIAKVLLS